MKYIKFVAIAIMAIFLYGCKGGQSTGLKIGGKISDAGNMSVHFDRTSPDNTNEGLMHTKTDANGTFSLVFPEKLSAGTYRVRAGAKSADLILNGKESEVKFDGDLKSFGDLTYKVTGAPLTEKYLGVISDFVAKKINTKGLRDLAMNADPIVGYMISSKMFRLRPEFLDLHKSVSKKMNEMYPDTDLAKMFTGVVANVEREYAKKMAAQKVKVGELAPDIVLPDVKGETRKLSDLKGKVVLIDFWASWCGPCRKANPHVVDVYQRYKDKGFDVFSVSLDGLDSRTKARYTGDQVKMQIDRSKERWLAAIAKDKLSWDNHVSDLKKWESVAAATYGITSIPKTFLVGRDGKIVHINPRFDLEEQVKKHI